jgi:hypothetical protein
LVVTVGETLVEPEVPLAVKLVPVQEVALVELQVRVDDWLEVMDVGEAERVAVGAGVPVPVAGVYVITMIPWAPMDVLPEVSPQHALPPPPPPPYNPPAAPLAE